MGVQNCKSSVSESSVPIRNKRHIKPHVQSDFHTTNIVEKFSTNHSECFKIPDSQTEQYKNSFIVRTVREWNQLEESHIHAETVNSFSISATNFLKHTHRGCRCQNWILPLKRYRYRFLWYPLPLHHSLLFCFRSQSCPCMCSSNTSDTIVVLMVPSMSATTQSPLLQCLGHPSSY